MMKMYGFEPTNRAQRRQQQVRLLGFKHLHLASTVAPVPGRCRRIRTWQAPVLDLRCGGRVTWKRDPGEPQENFTGPNMHVSGLRGFHPLTQAAAEVTPLQQSPGGTFHVGRDSHPHLAGHLQQEDDAVSTSSPVAPAALGAPRGPIPPSPPRAPPCCQAPPCSPRPPSGAAGAGHRLPSPNVRLGCRHTPLGPAAHAQLKPGRPPISRPPTLVRLLF